MRCICDKWFPITNISRLGPLQMAFHLTCKPIRDSSEFYSSFQPSLLVFQAMKNIKKVEFLFLSVTLSYTINRICIYNIIWKLKWVFDILQLCIKVSNVGQFYYYISKRKGRKQTYACSMSSFFGVRMHNYFRCLLLSIFELRNPQLAAKQIRIG